MKTYLDQIGMDGYSGKGDDPVKALVSEVFQDPTPIAQIEKIGYINSSMPEEVKKGRSNLIDDVISANQSDHKNVVLENDEISELTQNPVSSRISLSFGDTEEGVVMCSRVLTNFDREVIDAVSSLAPFTQIMTAATIYRVITGKNESSPVNSRQKQRVEESMDRCSGCKVTIDITSKISNDSSYHRQRDESVTYSGQAISFETIKHSNRKGTTTYYKVAYIPPFYRFAEKLGKISVVPLRLLDSPVSKTDSVIAMQSFLLREIDTMKRDVHKSREINWNDLYQMASQEGRILSKKENLRIRTSILSILDFWISEEFILNYESLLEKDLIEIVLSGNN